MAPIYEYECRRCGIFESWQTINAAPLKTCPDCRSPHLKKLISLPAEPLIEPKGIYQPLPGLDEHGKTREEKISPAEYERRDQDLKNRMLATRDRAKKDGITPTMG